MSAIRRVGFALLAWALAISALAGSILPSGTSLYPNQAVYSPAGKYYAVMQGDGNFAMYRASDGAVLFATMKFGSWVAMQTDGNLVEYSSASTALWYSYSAWLRALASLRTSDFNKQGAELIMARLSDSKTEPRKIMAFLASEYGPPLVQQIGSKDRFASLLQRIDLYSRQNPQNSDMRAIVSQVSAMLS
jgi:hypothetical protein